MWGPMFAVVLDLQLGANLSRTREVTEGQQEILLGGVLIEPTWFELLLRELSSFLYHFSSTVKKKKNHSWFLVYSRSISVRWQFCFSICLELLVTLSCFIIELILAYWGWKQFVLFVLFINRVNYKGIFLLILDIDCWLFHSAVFHFNIIKERLRRQNECFVYIPKIILDCQFLQMMRR